MSKRIAVFCYSHNQFLNFISQMAKEDRQFFKEVKSIDDVRGAKFAAVIRIENYYDMPNYADVFNLACSRIQG